MGTQIMFEHNLEQWRQEIGITLVYENVQCGRLMSSLSFTSEATSPLESLSLSRASTPSRETHFSPYQNEKEDCRICLSNVLNETAKGTMIVEYYNKYLKFQEDQRIALINLIAQFFEEKGVQISLSQSYKLEREILERFPTEKLVSLSHILLVAQVIVTCIQCKVQKGKTK